MFSTGLCMEKFVNKTSDIDGGHLANLDLSIDHYIKMGLLNKREDLFISKLQSDLKYAHCYTQDIDRENVLKSAQKIAQKMYKFGIRNPLINNLRVGNFDESIDILQEKFVYSRGTNFFGISRNKEFIRMKIIGFVFKIDTQKSKYLKLLNNVFNR